MKNNNIDHRVPLYNGRLFFAINSQSNGFARIAQHTYANYRSITDINPIKS